MDWPVFSSVLWESASYPLPSRSAGFLEFSHRHLGRQLLLRRVFAFHLLCSASLGVSEDKVTGLTDLRTIRNMISTGAVTYAGIVWFIALVATHIHRSFHAYLGA